MSVMKRLIVVDDNWRFAVHVWRHLSGMMEFGLHAPTGTEASEGERAFGLEGFERVTPDGALAVVWHNPRKSTASEVFRKSYELDGATEVWCALDIRGVPDWNSYYDKFLETFGGAGQEAHAQARERAWIMSSYGRHDRADVPAARAKTIESLRALARAMKLSGPLCSPPVAVRTKDQVHILVTGAGFERKEDVKLGEGIGCPSTRELLERMRPSGEPMPKDCSTTPLTFPDPFSSSDLLAAAKSGNLDRWWDAVLNFFPRNHAGFESKLELAWREAFRRSLLEHDYGQLLQSIAAAQLNWDYWLTTNYTRFADRAVDMVCSQNHGASWRAITTPLEADAIAPLISEVGDLAVDDRILVKLHGDIGHVWTMAIAGEDKLPDSKLSVRPQLHRMYSMAETMVLGTLWERRAAHCTWHVVGHGLQDRSLVGLIARVIQRTAAICVHEIIYVDPFPPEDPEVALRQRFDSAGDGGSGRAARLSAGPDGDCSALKVAVKPLSALVYMSRLHAKGLEPAPRISDVAPAGVSQAGGLEDDEGELLEEIG